MQSSLEAYQSLEIIGRPGSGKSLVEIISHIDLDRLQYSFARGRSQISGGTRGARSFVRHGSQGQPWECSPFRFFPPSNHRFIGRAVEGVVRCCRTHYCVSADGHFSLLTSCPFLALRPKPCVLHLVLTTRESSAHSDRLLEFGALRSHLHRRPLSIHLPESDESPGEDSSREEGVVDPRVSRSAFLNSVTSRNTLQQCVAVLFSLQCVGTGCAFAAPLQSHSRWET